MSKVEICFSGYKNDVVAKKFYTWIVDGGLEDAIIDTLSDSSISVEGISDFDNEKLKITISSQGNNS